VRERRERFCVVVWHHTHHSQAGAWTVPETRVAFSLCCLVRAFLCFCCGDQHPSIRPADQQRARLLQCAAAESAGKEQFSASQQEPGATRAPERGLRENTHNNTYKKERKKSKGDVAPARCRARRARGRQPSTPTTRATSRALSTTRARPTAWCSHCWRARAWRARRCCHRGAGRRAGVHGADVQVSV
jgi:hypothetical protein